MEIINHIIIINSRHLGVTLTTNNLDETLFLLLHLFLQSYQAEKTGHLPLKDFKKCSQMQQTGSLGKIQNHD